MATNDLSISRLRIDGTLTVSSVALIMESREDSTEGAGPTGESGESLGVGGKRGDELTKSEGSKSRSSTSESLKKLEDSCCADESKPQAESSPL